MALLSILKLLLFFTSISISFQQEQPVLNSGEQDSVYHVLSSINSDVPWRTLFPDDLCSYPPHGIVCDYFTHPTSSTVTVHITELSFGYISDYTPNPPCSSNSTISPLLFTSFKHLRKLLFYQCFTKAQVFASDIPTTFGSFLEELVFINNPAFVGPLSGIIRNFTSLRRLVLTGNGVYGNIPDGLGDLVNLEEITLSRNKLSGQFSSGLSKLKKLKILDLSGNDFDGDVPFAVGNLSQLLKLDLSCNRFCGKIPESLSNLQALELMDLSYNRFGKFGLPLFVGEMRRLKEVYLSGNVVGGEIPEIWEKLGGILRIGFSGMGLVGEIPASMGVHLRSLCYLGLDNNSLEGKVPQEFGLLQFVSEVNLENNNLSGTLPFSAGKLRLKGNPNIMPNAGSSSSNNPNIMPNAVNFIHASNYGLWLSPSFQVTLLFSALFILLV